MQTGRLSVQIGETGGKACDDTVIFGGGLDLAEYVDDDLVDRFEIFPAFFFDQIKDAALCLIQDRFQRFTVQITGGTDIVSDLDQTTKCGLLCYDPCIRLSVGRGRNSHDQSGQKIGVTDLGWRILLLKLLRQGNLIDRVAGQIQFNHGII